MIDFEDYFRKLTGFDPLPFQARLALEELPEVLDVPTGLGKTAAAVLPFLYRRLTGAPETPRRLVYCLPMRVLVRQVHTQIEGWLERAALLFEQAGRPTPSVHLMLGGDVDATWDDRPEATAIIIGTQDLLISRVLNRGYAMSRYRWPIHFGLLNNDCLWVFDETQLMGVTIETSAQLQAFRRQLGTVGPAHSLWMSATLGRAQLDTVDHPEPDGGFSVVGLSDDDRRHPLVAKRLGARKALAAFEAGIRKESDKKELKALAKEVIARHRSGSLTLVIVNRVARAQALYQALHGEGRTKDDTLLIHSRFRPADRAEAEGKLSADLGDCIAVATQAVEAGVDISARTLITELAPWPSLVQRFGRCNRYGEYDDAAVYWVEIDERTSKGKCALPYAPNELAMARTLLQDLDEAGIASVSGVSYEAPPIIRPVLRRKDLLELFDTTPDLSGNDIDISPFVRDQDDLDVRFYWRQLVQPPKDSEPQPARDELCAVSLFTARAFINTLNKKRPGMAWRWDHLHGRWDAVRGGRSLAPGERVLLFCKAGGYDEMLGWTAQPRGEARPVHLEPPPSQSAITYAGDPATRLGRWVTLDDHLHHVQEQVDTIAATVGLVEADRRALTRAAAWHDIGKAHWSFQQMLSSDPEAPPPNTETFWAKSSHGRGRNTERPAFRHELGSALLYVQHSERLEARLDHDLVAFLIACHHGKVRLSIRAMPNEKPPENPDLSFARGWHDGDLLPPSGRLHLADGTELEPTAVDLAPLAMGPGSWLGRMIALRDRVGVFHLALLEAVMRSGDGVASRAEAEQQGDL